MTSYIHNSCKDFLTCILLIGYASYEECVKIKQARPDRYCLLVSLECIDRHHSPSTDDLEGGLSVRQISASSL